MIEAKKGEKVIVKGFTGIKLGVFEVTGTTKKTISVTKRSGEEMIFDRKTGKQTNVEEGKEKYANTAMDDDGSYVAPTRKKAAAPVKAEEEAPKKSSKKPVKKSSKKPAPVEDDEDEDDEDDEDEFEEIDD